MFKAPNNPVNAEVVMSDALNMFQPVNKIFFYETFETKRLTICYTQSLS